MKWCVTVVAWLACNSSSTLPDSGGPPPQCDGGCGTTVQDYCQVNACPTDPTSDIATLCTQLGPEALKIYSGCGYTFVFSHTGTNQEEDVFDVNGNLVAILASTSTSGTCCSAGPAGFDIPGLEGCTLAQLTSCVVDGGLDGGAD